MGMPFSNGAAGNRKGGRPTIRQEMRALIQRLSRENVLWSAETIHGHLVLLGFDPPCPETIRKYMVKHKGGTDMSQTWLTFLRNHLEVSWAMDFFTVVVRNNSVRCSQQKLKDAFSVLRREFIRVTMRYAASPYPVDFEGRRLFGNHSCTYTIHRWESGGRC